MPAVGNFCKQMQIGLNELIGKGAIPQQLRTRNGVGMVDALRSDLNTSGIELVQGAFSSSKERELLIRYLQRADATVGTSPVDPCATTATKLFKQDSFQVDQFATKSCSFDMSEWIAYCESGSDVVSQQIASLFDPILQEVDKNLISLMSALVLPSATVADTNAAPIPLTMFADFATRSINLAGQDDLINTFADIQASLQPIVVGQGVLRNYANVADFGCCNQLGQDIGAVLANSPFAWFDDRNVGSVLADANDIYAWEPGKVQLATWNRYVDEQAWEESRNEMNGTITDPITGITFDMQVRREICNQYPVITVTLSLNYGLWTIPVDAFPTGDEYEGVKYLLRFTAA